MNTKGVHVTRDDMIIERMLTEMGEVAYITLSGPFGIWNERGSGNPSFWQLTLDIYTDMLPESRRLRGREGDEILSDSFTADSVYGVVRKAYDFLYYMRYKGTGLILANETSEGTHEGN